MRKIIQVKALIICLFTFQGCVAHKPSPTPMQNPPIKYYLNIENPEHHYFKVKMEVNTLPIKDGTLEVEMPVWTPGSYLIREFPGNVQNFKASIDGNEVNSRKTNKNTWQIDLEAKKPVTIEYNVYAFELSVRTSFLDFDHGYVNGASVFMTVPEFQNQEAILQINPPKNLKTISTALPSLGNNTFKIKDFDTLVDSPIEIGNHEVLSFTAAGVNHKIAMYSNGPIDYNKEKVLNAYQKIVEASTSVIGEHPCKEYLFIIHHLPEIGGGLEHLYSTTCQTSPFAYGSESDFVDFMGLVAHEYFHLWNVKRIRPIALGPFNYNAENYTNMLWVAEGFTSYYQDDIRKRAGLISADDFLNMMISKIGSIENQPGNKVQSVAESSWDAWIKAYRPNENSYNSTISYYTKGSVIANILNLIILKETKGQKSLDDVLKDLWVNYYLKLNRGYTDIEFQKSVEKIAGINLDDFFKKHIYGTETIDYKKYFDYAGIVIEKELSKPNQAKLGAAINGNKIVRVETDGSAYVSGLSVEDEIISVDGVEFKSIAEVLVNKKIGDRLDFVVSRYGREFNVPVVLKADQNIKFKAKLNPNATEEQKVIFNSLLHI